MKIFAIGDLHLALDPRLEKPMDIFGEGWIGHTERLYQNWNEMVTADDIVIVCGDISWALKPDEVMADLDWIHALPGRKIFIKGNHDLWWTSANKLNKLYADGTMQFLQCNAQILEVPANAKVRGPVGDVDAQDVYKRQTGDGIADEGSLRGSSEVVAQRIKDEIQSKVGDAGLEIIEARITYLAYAPEIAAVMLQRQQASAVVDARTMIVDGAVGMVKMALEKLEDRKSTRLNSSHLKLYRMPSSA